jgi:site-specific DNA recombinase
MATSNGAGPGKTPSVVRCAIYSRKSTEEGLEQEFNSLDAQREAAEAYIKSQVHEGWTCLGNRYEDGGFTGGNMDRPALKRLLADIEAGLVNAVVVHKVDRLSRSLLDFARMMETFDKHRTAFVSVTQQFNTASSFCVRVRFGEPNGSGANNATEELARGRETNLPASGVWPLPRGTATSAVWSLCRQRGRRHGHGFFQNQRLSSISIVSNSPVACLPCGGQLARGRPVLRVEETHFDAI